MARISFPEMEESLVKRWQEQDTFKRSVDERPADKAFVFYDGPPFATGMPHYGHIVASTQKDVIPRFWTMRGYRVERRWGWDCHGLPIENLIEKDLGLKTKDDIEKLGVDKFNDACAASVLTYAHDWKVIIERLGRWVDMDNDYKTMDPSYTESIWWAFKQLHEKGLIYEGKKAMHLCPRCETTLSNFEVTLGYKDVTDTSAIVQFQLVDEPDTYILAWTTTPWTLPGNIALAVGKDIEYVKVSANDKTYILAKERVAATFNDIEHTITGIVTTAELAGKTYVPLFPYFESENANGNMFTVYEGEFVTTEEGTGVVHIASGYGEDDYQLSLQYNLPLIQHVGTDGVFVDAVTDFAGEHVKSLTDPGKTDKAIVEYLDTHNFLFTALDYVHSYPHCWRCDYPLLNFAASSWFVRVTDIKDRMQEHNETVRWVPDHVKTGRFGKWLANAKDWAISRDRYWGAPIPVWQAADGEMIVIGSIAELKELTGIELTDLHKQYVDTVTIERDGKVFTRVPQVLDCWFESGSMPFAQQHYPFENADKFSANHPADFIAEGLDQTRGWFYTLTVLSTALFDKPAFKNVIVNGLVLAEDGKKMSKKLKNYPEPKIVFDKHGADALRFYLMSSPVVNAENLRFSEQGVDQVVKRLLLTLWNVHTYYTMFAEQHIEKTGNSISDLPSTEHSMDAWLLAYLHETTTKVTAHLEAYEIQPATRLLEDLVQETSTWYLRRSRSRFRGSVEEQAAALSTLRYALIQTVKLLAPFTPFISEQIYLNILALDKDELKKVELKDASVHLEMWPVVDADYANPEILQAMSDLRSAVEQTLAAREEAGIKVRQPLASVTLPAATTMPAALQEVLAEEVNVKQVLAGDTFALDMNITPELAAEGTVREIIRTVNALRKQLRLTIKDRVLLVYATDDAATAAVLEQFGADIALGVSADQIAVKGATQESSDESLELHTSKVNGVEVLFGIRVL